jgi:uncharacterized membrane protein
MGSGWKRSSPWLLAGLLAGAGVTHFVTPGPYRRIVPKALQIPLVWWAAAVARRAPNGPSRTARACAPGT